MSLRIRHPDIDPALITQTLGLQPQHAWRAGDPREGSVGESLSGTYHESYWVGGLSAQRQGPAEQLTVEHRLPQALRALGKSFDFVQGLRASGGSAEVQVSIFAHDEFRIELLSEVAALLGRMGITMTIEVKPTIAADATER